jgi:hypothetical protein
MKVMGAVSSGPTAIRGLAKVMKPESPAITVVDPRVLLHHQTTTLITFLDPRHAWIASCEQWHSE